jgi:hypothetical protein
MMIAYLRVFIRSQRREALEATTGACPAVLHCPPVGPLRGPGASLAPIVIIQVSINHVFPLTDWFTMESAVVKVY